ncbi:O-antigen ligase family protein [Pseudomonas silvicola]|nr:O-antigen ligase family protein [Pseudomonas silvicola]
MRDTARPNAALTTLCVCAYLAFSLQQVVIGHGLAVGLSLGSMLLRAFALCTSAWMLWHHGVPKVLRGPAWAIALCLVVLVVSTLTSPRLGIALRFAPRYGLELLLLWSMLNLCVAFPAFARAAALASVVILWLGLLLGLAVHLDAPGARPAALLFYPQETLDRYLPRSSGLYEHPALFAATAVMSLAMALHLRNLHGCSRGTLLLALVGCLLALLASGARNPLLGLGVLALAVSWRVRGRPYARRFAIVAGLVLALLVAWITFDRLAELTSATHESSLTAFTLGRTYIWAAAWQAWLSHPLFGLGSGVFQFLLPDFAGGRFPRGELHAHNLLLALLSELGLAGAFGFIALGLALWRPWLAPATPGRGWALVTLLVLLAFGLFDYYVPFYCFALHATLMVGLLYARLGQPQAGTPWP